MEGNRRKDEKKTTLQMLTKEVENEVSDMCTYAAAMENKGIVKGLKALVQSLREYIKDFDSLYKAVTKNEDYKNVSREEVMKYCK